MWFYVFIPVGVAALGAIYTSVWPPSDKMVNAFQHFAAGVVFYAAAGELLPDATQRPWIWPIIIGGVLGITVMLLLRHFTEKAKQGPAGLLAASGFDAVIDGIVLGLGFSAGQHQGLLLAIALAIEFLFLGLSIAGAFNRKTSRWLVIGGTVSVSLGVPLGSLLALPIGTWPLSYRMAAFAFGLVALLYLVAEELLAEAHEKPETNWGTTMFFVGFLALTVLDQALRS